MRVDHNATSMRATLSRPMTSGRVGRQTPRSPGQQPQPTYTYPYTVHTIPASPRPAPTHASSTRYNTRTATMSGLENALFNLKVGSLRLSLLVVSQLTLTSSQPSR
jgi:hypothetical protein